MYGELYRFRQYALMLAHVSSKSVNTHRNDQKDNKTADGLAQ
jgi:hypothetical protein